MRLPRAALIVSFLAGTLFNIALQAKEPRLTRVFYLQGMERREAVTLLRSQVQVRQMAEVASVDAVVVTEVAERVDRSESLLREHDALVRAVDPHGPLSFERVPDAEMETRVFAIEGPDTRSAVTVLRAIYQIGELTESADDNSVTVRASPARLDAAEALLRQLELLAEVKGPGAG